MPACGQPRNQRAKAIRQWEPLSRVAQEPRRANDIVFLITDGGPTDSWQNAARLVHEGEAAKKFKFFAVGVEGANFDILKQISVSDPIKLKGMRFRDLFAWLSSSLSSVSQSQPGDDVALVNPVTPNGWGSIA